MQGPSDFNAAVLEKVESLRQIHAPTSIGYIDIAILVASEFQRLKSPHLEDEVFIGFGTYLFSRLLEEQSRYHSP